MVSDIRFWILLFFIIRLYGITLPPLEVAHNWRQTTVTMVARNFYETGPDILYPRIDIAGEKTGITGMEFPLFNYLIFLVSELFGYAHWYGRLINLFISSLGIWFFCGVIRNVFDKRWAFYSSMILLGSIWFAYSRKIMPDTFSFSFVIAALYFAVRYFSSGYRWNHLLGFLILSTIGILTKLPSGFALVFTLFWILNRRIPLKPRMIFLLAAGISGIPAFWWYWVHVPFLVETYGFWHFFMGKDILTGLNEILYWPVSTLRHFYDDALKFSGFFLFLAGLIIAVIRKDYQVVILFLTGFAAFFMVMLKAGYNFVHHSYYIIPFVPVMALVAGYGLSQLPKRWLTVVLLSLCVLEGVLNQQHDFSIKPHYAAIENLEKELDAVTRPTDLILINSGEVPTPMYFAHRKGWVASNEQISSQEFIRQLHSKGLRYILILKKAFGEPMDISYTVVFENDTFTLYKIDQEIHEVKN